MKKLAKLLGELVICIIFAGAGVTFIAFFFVTIWRFILNG